MNLRKKMIEGVFLDFLANYSITNVMAIDNLKVSDNVKAIST